MQPTFDRTRFGSITIDRKVYEHDVLVRLGGEVEKRNKKLSKAVHGTSHIISLAEARHVYQKGAALLLIGAGQDGRVTLSDEAAAYFQRHRCQVQLLPTPEVIPVWNRAEGAVIGLVHVTC
ncbi:MAG TPA: MTH938/NDUFAF3 family protein [Actinomycetota bacterium]|nr:MTH938/NDUFAF3 family protein [Actinomycetota bacterium]